VYCFINRYAAELTTKLLGIGEPERYIRLREASRRTDVRTDAVFQREYRDYWRMNPARLSSTFYELYFDILGECLTTGSTDVAMIVRRFGSSNPGESRPIQFSFATKLAHMVDDQRPVYDSFVAAFYFFVSPSGEKPVASRLRTFLAFYEFLRSEYHRILSLGLLQPAIESLRKHVRPGYGLADERIIDWLVWAYVSQLRSGAQLRGNMLYK
jgi:hypothetical protein